MTKKHFIKIAAILKNQRTFIENVNSEGFEKRIINSIEIELIKIFTTDNPRFDIDKFLQASR